MSERKIVILDANAILRYLITSDKEKANAVSEILSNRMVLVMPEVVAEVVYALAKFYDFTRNEVSEGIGRFLNETKCRNNSLINAVTAFGATKLDFVDCLLYEYSKNPEYEVFTFDKDLKRLIDES